MIYTVHLAHPAVKVLDRLDRKTERRVRDRLKELADNPYDVRLSKPVAAVKGLRCARVGEWRVLFTVNDAEKAIYVAAIRPRGRAYRDL